jgi:(R,R)-butanediol dehydrogenase/meso-butanediol dehydrogenase/diacetyl reductase
MKAVVWHGRRDVRYGDVPDAPDPGPGEVRVRVAWCGICGSDLHEYLHGPFVIPTRPHPTTGRCAPVVLGHEISGVVESVGVGVGGIDVGRPVALNALIPCGDCDMCRAGRPVLCRILAHLGQSADGGLAEAVTVPADMVVTAEADVPLDLLALAEPLAVAWRCVRRAGLRRGDRLLVLGAGPIGLAVAQVARLVHDCRVTVADVADARLRMARGTGLDTLDPTGDRPSAEWSHVVDCTGSPQALGTALDLLAPGGTVLLAGLPPRPSELDVARLVLREATVGTALGHTVPEDLTPAVRLLEQGLISADTLVTDRIRLADTVELGLETLAGPDRDHHLKVLVKP